MTPVEKIYNSLLENSSQITTIVFLVPICIGILKSKTLDYPLKFFWIYMIVNMIPIFLEQGFVWSVRHYTSFFLPYLKKYEISDTNFLQIISRLIDYIFLGLFFSKIFTKSSIGEKVKYLSIFLFVGSIVVYFFIDGYNKYGTINPVINRVYLVLLPLLYLRLETDKSLKIPLMKNPFILICFGILVINLFSLLFGFFGNGLNETNFQLFVIFSIIRNLLSIIGTIFFSMALWHSRNSRFIKVK